MAMLRTVLEFVPYIIGVISLIGAILAGGHAVLYRRDARTAIAWVGLVWLVPLIGSLLYFALGVNRIQRRAINIRGGHSERVALNDRFRADPVSVAKISGGEHLAPLVHLVDRVVHRPLTTGNKVSLLANGDEAYPAMIQAIGRAERSVCLTSFIFDNDRAGQMFVAALVAAMRRGVEVRVLIDGVGVRYSRPGTHRLLSREGVPVARFLPPVVPWRFPYLNLRSHRKIAVIDGRLGFTGGMNISEGNLLELSPPPKNPILDVHARLEGPIVAQLQEAFVEDWEFVTGEQLSGDAWFPELAPSWSVLARGIPDGPDENFDELRLTLLGVLSVARNCVRILTPYFLPDAALITALNVAAMRGVEVDILIPSRGNLTLVQWASTAQLWQVLERGCRIWLTPPPFDHAKLMVVDRLWTLLGSGNWDPRSLRLNFEFNVECYCGDLAARVEDIIEKRLANAREVTLADVDGRSLPLRLRDGLARLLSPYL